MEYRQPPTVTDRFGRRLADAEPWAQARTLADLCDLSARWLAGESTYNPSYLSTGPAPETTALIPDLVAFNQAGFMTDTSQPGVTGDGWAQRAFVHGFCEPALVDPLYHLSTKTDLITLVYPPGTQMETSQVPVTTNNGKLVTRAGIGLSPEWLTGIWQDEVSPAGFDALVSAHQITIIDPAWGRDDLLWPAVRDTLTARGM